MKLEGMSKTTSQNILLICKLTEQKMKNLKLYTLKKN